MISQEQPHWSFEQDNQKLKITISGNWLAQYSSWPKNINSILKQGQPIHEIEIDTSKVKSWDSIFIAFLREIQQQASRHHIKIRYNHLPDSATKLLTLLKNDPPKKTKQTQLPFQPFYNLGGWALQLLSNVGDTAYLSFLCLKGFIRSLTHHSFMRRVDLLRDIKAAGPSALIIISIVNFLVGSILAFVGAVQLRKFSADIYIANLVGIATIREMAAVMTAIVISGRTGGAYAARIATMKGNEEIDALQVMGISVIEYLILPSVLSLMLTMPILYLYGCFMGVLGGLIVSILMLKISIIGFLQQTFWAVPFSQFIFAIVKTLCFAFFIGMSSCYIGIQSGRSAADVGISATKAVVIGIVGVIAIDSLAAVLADTLNI